MGAPEYTEAEMQETEDIQCFGTFTPAGPLTWNTIPHYLPGELLCALRNPVQMSPLPEDFPGGQ